MISARGRHWPLVRSRGWRLLSAMLTVGLLGACTASAPPDTDPTPTGPPTYSGPVLPDLTVERVYENRDLPVKEVKRATPVGNTLVLSGTNDFAPIAAAVDLSSGKTLWQGNGSAEFITADGKVTSLGMDGFAADDGHGGLVLATTYRDVRRGGNFYEAARGVVAYSAIDRTLRWHTEVIAPVLDEDGRSRPETLSVVAATPDLVVVNLDGDGNHGTDRVEDGTQQPRTIGLDARTGRKLWSIDDTLTRFVVGDRVLANQRRNGTESVPLALDLTGREMWRLPGESDATWFTAGNGLGIVQTQAGMQLVNPADGRTGPVLPDANHDGPGVDTEVLTDAGGHSVVAWDRLSYAARDRPSALFTQGMDDPEPLVGGTPIPGSAAVQGQGRGYAWIETGEGSDTRVAAYDRTGARRSPELAGRLRMINDELVLIDGLTSGFEVHRYR